MIDFLEREYLHSSFRRVELSLSATEFDFCAMIYYIV